MNSSCNAVPIYAIIHGSLAADQLKLQQPVGFFRSKETNDQKDAGLAALPKLNIGNFEIVDPTFNL